MKAIFKYVSDDGLEFFNKKECLFHEEKYKQAKAIIDKLKPIPDTLEFKNGGFFIPQDMIKVLEVRKEFLEFIQLNYTQHQLIQDTIDNPLTTHLSWASHIIDETVPYTIYSLWGRFTCINNKGEEWGSSYYAN